ncbi:hypothetical protein [Jiangella aurantiaca]|nr:hypothetical protein [Jiangella aurantiaca]
MHGYTVAYAPVGEPDPVAGPPTQLATFPIGDAGMSVIAIPQFCLVDPGR